LRIRIQIVVDVTVEWGFQGLVELVIALVLAVASAFTISREFAMNVFKNIVCVGAALMPAWLESPITQVA
jgi:hypothetical protein